MRSALIIANTEYTDPGLAQLTAPGKDAEDFARVLKDQDMCAFDEVNILLNQLSSSVIEAVDGFFDQKKPDDMLVLYFSGHGVRDEIGSLYLAFTNTIRTRLRSTAIKADYIKEAMDQSRSKRQVVILDCCNSGAFPQGTKAETGGVMGLTQAFQGYGRFVLTASDATQYAWEGDRVIGETDNSLFTHFLVKGLEGEADNDGDGKITVDELYDYTYEEISKVTAKQTPTKSSSKVEGEIILRQFTRMEDIKLVALPEDLISEMEDLRPYVREMAVQKLEKILKGKNIGLRRSAIEALEKIASDENTTRRVSQLATQALEAYRQVEQRAEAERKAKEEAERLAILKAEEERLAREKAESERKAKEEVERLLRAQAEREAAEREAARLKTEREAAELASHEATKKAEKEKAEKEAAEQEAALKAEREAIELALRKKTEREAAEKAEHEAMELAARRKAEREAKEKVVSKEGKAARPAWLIYGAIGGAIIVLAFCGFASLNYLSGIFRGSPPTEASTTLTEVPTISPTEEPATSLPAIKPTMPPLPTPTLGIGSTMIGEDGATLVYVPEGEFTMGSDTLSAEQPIHQVYLDSFWIDQTEVTNKQYAACVSARGCTPPANISSSTRPNYYGNSEFDEFPVIYVSWNDAIAYCKWAGRRLPTEAEWEKAARGIDARIYPWGNNPPNDTLLNYNRNVGDTTKVGSYEMGKSFFGVYDMSGNVWEWVNDWYQSDYYATLGDSASNPQGPSNGEQRALRGGSWDFDTKGGNYSTADSANRGSNYQTEADSSNGFRCAYSP